MKRYVKNLLSRLLNHLNRSPRIKYTGQRVLRRVPRLRRLVLRIMHGGSIYIHEVPPDTFDARGEQQKRLLDDLQQRWNRQP